MKNFLIIMLVAVGCLLLTTQIVLASVTSGSIIGSDRYAWSENAGWIDFGCTNCGVTVTDTAVTGYAYGENIGWIDLGASTSGVVNTAGTLSGYAWSENAGWIHFAPSGGGVSIDNDGNWSGYAYGELIGWIVFNCSTTSSCGTVSYKINTDWRPASTRGGGSIISLGSNVLVAPPAPVSGWKVNVTSVNGETGLSVNAGEAVRYIAVSNTIDFSKASLIPYIAGQSIQLLDNREVGFVKLYNAWGYSTEPIVVNAKSGEMTPTTKPDSSAPSILPDGSLIKGANSPAVYYIQNGQKRPILNGGVFEAQGFKWGDIIEVDNLQDYRTGYMLGNDIVVEAPNKVAQIPTAVRPTQVLGEKVVVSEFEYGLGLGMSDPAVRILQSLLASQSDIYPEGKITGYYGPLTVKAVQRFQLKYKVVSDASDAGYGYVGPKTRIKLMEIF